MDVFVRLQSENRGVREKTKIYLSQRDALKFMHAKNVPGFTDELIDTYARKVEGDISLAQEVIDSRMDPTAGQQFLNQMNMIKFSLKGEIVYRALFASLGV